MKNLILCLLFITGLDLIEKSYSMVPNFKELEKKNKNLEYLSDKFQNNIHFVNESSINYVSHYLESINNI